MFPIMEDARVTEGGSGDWPGQAVAWLLLAAAYLGVALIRWRLLRCRWSGTRGSTPTSASCS